LHRIIITKGGNKMKLGSVLSERGRSNALYRARRKYPAYTVTKVKKVHAYTWDVYGHKRRR